MHNLLKRQLKKAFGQPLNTQKSGEFYQMVDAHITIRYRQG
jgi:hypothetical protein